MNVKYPVRRISSPLSRPVSSAPVKAGLATALAIVASLGLPAVHAATGTWNVDAAGNWSTATNWSGSTVADGAGFTANLTFNIGTARTVTLDSLRSLGVLNIGDTNATHSYTLATGLNTLTFNNGGSDAQLNQVSTSFGDTISGNLAIGGNGNLTVTNAASAKTLTISAGITSSLTSGTQNLTFNNANAVSVSGIIGNGTSGGTIAVTKSGAGTTTLSAANTYSGATTVSAGTLTLSNALALQNSALDTTASITGDATNGLKTTVTTLTLGGLTGNKDLASVFTTTSGGYSGVTALTLNPQTGFTNTYSGIIADGAAGMTLIKTGTGTQILSGSNSYTGNTTVNAGTLVADTITNGTVLSTSSVLVLGGGTFQLKGNSGTQSQILNGLTLNAGTTGVVDANNLGTSTTLDLRGTTGLLGITRNTGATVDFKATNGTLGTTSIIKTVQANDANGILGAWATVNGGADLAKNDGSNVITAYTGYTDIAALGSTIADGTNTNVRINSTGTTGNVALGATTTNINTLMQNSGTAATVDALSKTLRVGTTGGLFITPGGADLTIGTAVNSGTLTAGGTDNTAGELIVTNNSSTGTLKVNSVVANNGSGVVSLTKSGSGLTVLTGTNTYTGATTISAGTLQIGAGGTTGALATTGTITNNGTLLFNRTDAVTQGTHFSSSAISGTGSLVQAGGNTLTLNAANSFTGGLVIKSGTVTGATSANAFGANTSIITLGDSAGTANATLNGGAFTYLNPITVASGNTGTATITGSSAIFNGAIALNTHSLTFANSGTDLNLGGAVTGTGNLLINSAGTGIVKLNGSINMVGTITNTGIGSPSNGNQINGSIGANVTSIIQDSATAALALYGNNSSYSNGITIKKGAVSGNQANSLGASTNVITLGDSSGSSGASLLGSGNAGAITNAIQVASGNTGVAQIASTFSNSGTFSGLITLNSHDLTLAALYAANNNMTFSGGFASTGTGGNLLLSASNTGTITLSGATGINNVGTITNAGTGSGLSLISANIGSNVTNILQNSAASNLTFSGTNAYTGTTTVNAGTLTGTQTSGTPFSTGNVVLNGGTLQLTPTAAASVSGANALAGSTFTYAGGATLGLTKNASNSLSYTVGNASPSGSVLVRSNTGTLVIAPTASANLGSSEKFVVNGLSSAANINGIYNASVVDQVGSGNTGVGSFVKYDTTNGFLDASTGTSSYTTRAVDATLAANEISDVTTSLTAADTSNPYALRVGAVTLTNAGTTTVNGGASGVANSGLGGIILNPTATASVISGGTLAFGASEGVVYVGSGAGGGSITSAITGTAGLTKFGPGALTLNNAANTYTGTTTINSGTLAAGANDQIATGALTINGATSIFSLGAFTDTVGTVTVANFGSITGTGTLTSTGSFEMQSGSVGTILAGSGIALNKTTSGTVTLSGASTYTGATTVNAGTLQLNGANGSTTGATAYSLNGGTLFLDSSGTNNQNRINNASTIALNGGNFSIRGFSNSTLTENVGALSGTGNSTITLAYSGTLTNVVTLTAASFTHTAGNGTDLVNGNNLGQNSTGVNMGRIIVTAAPTLVGTTNAATTGVNAAAQNTKIVPFLVGESNANGAGTAFGIANTFVTYVAGSGLRPLSTVSEFTNNAITTGNNTYITAATASAANSSINSLVINGGDLSIDDTTTLTNTSGALLFATNNAIKPTGTTGGYTGGAENQITVNSGITGTISAIINGSQPLTKSGAGTLVLGGANTYTGTTTISAGTLALGSAGTIANSSAINLGTSTSRGTLDLTAKTSGFTLGSTQTLSGYGTVNIGAGKTLTINGTFAPGNSPGIVNVTGDLTLGSTSTTNMEIISRSFGAPVAGTDFDRVSVSGAVVFGGTLNINTTGLTGLIAGDSFQLFTAGSYTSGFTSVAMTGAYAPTLTNDLGVWTGANAGLLFTFTEGTGVLGVSAIPEPATYAAIFGGLALAGAVLRSRRRRS